MTTTNELTELEVHLDSVDFPQAVVMGHLRRAHNRAATVLSFSFDPQWLDRRFPLTVDPGLGLHEGDQYAQSGPLFGIFSDIAPDRWGRNLLQRREAVLARREERRPRLLEEWDFLTGVSDLSRMGALRLATDGGATFVSDAIKPIPPMARLRQLQHFAQRAEAGEALSPNEEEEEVALLIAPGSSLGGARPKATYQARDGSLWLAKFPSANDQWDVAAWEFVLNELAGQAGIAVPRTELLTLAGRRRTFVAARFDRTASGRRLYASAMTLTRRSDHDDRASYLDIAEAITLYGEPGTVDEDLEQLFRRVVFNVLTGHRDDHLRNHGFLGSPNGWRLAPSFDLNPMPRNVEHAIAIDEMDHAPDLGVVMATAPFYRLKAARADAILDDVSAIVSRWREVATKHRISRDETELMTNAFLV